MERKAEENGAEPIATQWARVYIMTNGREKGKVLRVQLDFFFFFTRKVCPLSLKFPGCISRA